MTRIVSAVGIAVGHDNTSADIERSKRIEAAIAAVIAKAQGEGMADVDEMRALILRARDEAAAIV